MLSGVIAAHFDGSQSLEGYRFDSQEAHYTEHILLMFTIPRNCFQKNQGNKGFEVGDKLPIPLNISTLTSLSIMFGVVVETKALLLILN